MKQNNTSTSAQINMPRERLLKHGPKALADYELLAILLKTGLTGKSVLTLAQDILVERGGLVGLLVSNYDELINIKGLGKAKIAEILAVTEIARRFVEAELITSDWVFNTPEQVKGFLLMHFKGLMEEQFGLLLLDQQHRFIAFELIAQGEVNSVTISMRQIITDVLRYHSAAVILVHNHPARSVEPSEDDRIVTARIEQALSLLDVRLLDHFIVAGNKMISMKAEGGW